MPSLRIATWNIDGNRAHNFAPHAKNACIARLLLDPFSDPRENTNPSHSPHSLDMLVIQEATLTQTVTQLRSELKKLKVDTRYSVTDLVNSKTELPKAKASWTEEDAAQGDNPDPNQRPKRRRLAGEKSLSWTGDSAPADGYCVIYDSKKLSLSSNGVCARYTDNKGNVLDELVPYVKTLRKGAGNMDSNSELAFFARRPCYYKFKDLSGGADIHLYSWHASPLPGPPRPYAALNYFFASKYKQISGGVSRVRTNGGVVLFMGDFNMVGDPFNTYQNYDGNHETLTNWLHVGRPQRPPGKGGGAKFDHIYAAPFAGCKLTEIRNTFSVGLQKPNQKQGNFSDHDWVAVKFEFPKKDATKAARAALAAAEATGATTTTTTTTASGGSAAAAASFAQKRKRPDANRAPVRSAGKRTRTPDATDQNASDTQSTAATPHLPDAKKIKRAGKGADTGVSHAQKAADAAAAAALEAGDFDEADTVGTAGLTGADAALAAALAHQNAAQPGPVTRNAAAMAAAAAAAAATANQGGARSAAQQAIDAADEVDSSEEGDP